MYSMYSYIITIIQLRHTVKEYQVLLSNAYNSFQHYPFICTVK